MSGVEDSDAVSSTSDEYILAPVQDGFDHWVTMDNTLCDSASTENSNTASVTSNPAQSEGALHGSVFVAGDFINAQQGPLTIPEQNIVSSPNEDIYELSEHGNEIDDPYLIRISVLEKRNEALEKQVEKLKKELEMALAGQSKEEQFRSTASTQQDDFRQGQVANSPHPPFQECKEDARDNIDSTEGDYIVPQEASCECTHMYNQQLIDYSDQVQIQNKHQMCVKSIPSSGVKCTAIVPYCRPRCNLTGEGVLIAILGPPCQTDGVPEMNIVLKQTMSRNNTQPDACESKLLELAYQRAPGAKYCLLQTTFDNSSMLVNPGVTAEAISFLVANWPHWKIDLKLHTLIVIIPYGGKYKVDEEKAVNEASAYGILIVAASGWGRMGIAFPAKLGAVISVAATRCDGTLAPFSPKGRELDIVDLGLLNFGSDFMFGTGISTVRVATDLALLFEHFSCTQSALIRSTCIDIYVVRELLEMTVGNVAATGKDVMGLIDLSKRQVQHYIKQILWHRDRRAISSDLMRDDAQFNTKYWSSENINKQYKKEHKDFPHLSGKNITIAIIDEINEAFLHHLKDHSVEVHTLAATAGVNYFSFSCTMLHTECCAKHIKVAGGHGLQCAAIIANTAPNCTILMIIRNNHDDSEKVALSIVMEEKADILILSSVTTDTVHLDYFNNISAHFSCRIVLCAAGNEGKCDTTSTVCYPSRARDVIVIGACDRYGKKCPYSSCGRQVDFLSPGQFSIADSSGRGGTCYSTSAAASFIALLLEYIDQKLSTVAKVEVWVSTEEEWKLMTLPSLARNTHLMRVLLSSSNLLLCQSKKTSSTKGFGALLIDNLNKLTPDGISQVIINFYTDSYTDSCHV